MRLKNYLKYMGYDLSYSFFFFFKYTLPTYLLLEFTEILCVNLVSALDAPGWREGVER